MCWYLSQSDTAGPWTWPRQPLGAKPDSLNLPEEVNAQGPEPWAEVWAGPAVYESTNLQSAVSLA